MAKRHKPTRPPKPELSVAVFCEKAVADKDNVYTIIRVVDILTIAAPSRPAKGDFIGLAITTLIGFKAGGAKGKHEITIVQTGPSGKPVQLASKEVEFLGGMTGAYVHSNMTGLRYEGDGFYEFAVRLNGRVYTRIPLQLSFALTPQASEQVVHSPKTPTKSSGQPLR